MAAQQASDTTNNVLLDAALAYAARGWNVMPIKPHAKTPLTEHGLHDATTDPDTIRWWWTIPYPRGNVAVVTGTISGIVVVDIDGLAGEQTWETLIHEHGDTPTLTALTGGNGLHFIYTHPGDGEYRNTASKLGPGVDTRGDGGYIVAAPSIHPSGERYEWLDQSVPIAPLPQWIRDALQMKAEPAKALVPRPQSKDHLPSGTTTNYARVALDGQAATIRNAPQGTRNHTLNQAAFRLGQLAAGGQIDEPTAIDELTAAAHAAGLAGTEIAATIRSGLAAGSRDPQYPDPTKLARSTRSPSDTAPTEQPKDAPSTSMSVETARATSPGDATESPDGVPPGPPQLEGHDDEDDPDGEINETDLGNARRLIRRHGHELRYATHLRGWLRWDSRRWAIDQDGYVDRCMHSTAQSILSEAAELSGEDERKRRVTWSFKSENARALESAMRVASTLRGTPVIATQLDADPWLLNVTNGTINLRTGQLRPHDQADLLTKLAPVTYNPDAQDDRWNNYLESALPDPELRAWVQRAVGYMLTGSTIEEILFFVHGPTRSGKSTFLEAIKAMLGDYARNADFETFLDRDHGGTARSDIARLAGARLVTSNEVDEGRKLAEGLVKTLTGGDTITARFLYRDEFEYAPQFKLVLAANHKPKVRHGDDAIWRRIRLVPFVHPPQTVDYELKNHLSRDPGARAAILAWAVRGCTMWQADGLRSVIAVREATQAYRAEMDPLAEFFADTCVFKTDDANTWVTASDLRTAYEEWAKEQGIKRTLSPNHFRELLEDRGCSADRKRIDGKLARLWRGIRLLAPNEEPQAAQLPGIDVTPVTHDGKIQEDPETHVTTSHETEKCDARDGQDAGSHDSTYVRAHDQQVPETPDHTSRASHKTVTSETPLPGTLPETGPREAVDTPDLTIAYGDGYTPCAGCGTPVMPSPGTVEHGFKTYCSTCEPF